MLRRRWLLVAYRPWKPAVVTHSRYWRRSNAVSAARWLRGAGWHAEVTYRRGQG